MGLLRALGGDRSAAERAAGVVTATLAVLPTGVVVAIAVGIFLGGGALRRHKRGRPDTWLYRQLQWRLAVALARHCPWLSPDGFSQGLVTRSGYWSTRRGCP